MAYKTEDGKTKHKTLWIVIFWCVMVVVALVLQAFNTEVQIPITQIVTVAGTLSTAYIATDKGIKIVDKATKGAK